MGDDFLRVSQRVISIETKGGVTSLIMFPSGSILRQKGLVLEWSPEDSIRERGEKNWP